MKREVKLLAAIAVFVIVAAFVGAYFYRSATQNERIGVNSNSNQSEPHSNVKAESLIRSDSPTLGSVNAPVTIVEFLDPECESCAAFAPIVKKAVKDYDGRIRLIIRYMPLHPNSLSAATFIEAAGEQGKYWEALDLLFQKQGEWGTKHGVEAAKQPDINTLFKKYAAEMNLEMDKMNSAFAENKFQKKVQRDYEDGEILAVSQTPTLFINGKRLMRLNDTDLRYSIDQELKK